MKRFHGWFSVTLTSCCAAMVFALLLQTNLTAQPATDKPDDAGQVADDLLKQMQDNPLIAPTGEDKTLRPMVPVHVDPRVVGVAPGQPQPTLRREGELVVNRRGRLTRDPNSSNLLYVFEADSRSVSEPPMILMPCQLLQSMENLVHDRGDKVVFLITGQVYVYRGANYLLPTMMKLAVDHGNLEN